VVSLATKAEGINNSRILARTKAGKGRKGRFALPTNMRLRLFLYIREANNNLFRNNNIKISYLYEKLGNGLYVSL